MNISDHKETLEQKEDPCTEKIATFMDGWFISPAIR